jgi:Spy/CpxP family protein refolding chaperone
MHPGFYHRWKRSHEGRYEAERASACGRGGWRRRHGHDRTMQASGHGGGFGVRRPLRYMAHRLDLDDDQIDTLAGILNVIKTERAQARLDEQKSIAGIADAVEGEEFDADKANEALAVRVAAAERLQEQVLETLRKTHEMLDPEQRKRLAYLLRSGQLTI